MEKLANISDPKFYFF